MGLINRFMYDPKRSHMIIARKVLRYINDTLMYGIMFPKTTTRCDIELIGFSDVDWCRDKVERRSTTGYLFRFL